MSPLPPSLHPGIMTSGVAAREMSQDGEEGGGIHTDIVTHPSRHSSAE